MREFPRIFRRDPRKLKIYKSHAERQNIRKNIEIRALIMTVLLRRCGAYALLPGGNV